MNYPDTQLLRAFAILLIINSHLDLYYPIKHFATGGAIGNSIFFFLSAFGLYLSQQNKNKQFREFMADRISRIYPSLWIVLIFLMMPIMLFSGKLSIDNATTFIGYFFNPPYWFLQSLIVYYILSFYFLNQVHGNNRKISMFIFLGFMILIYFSCYFSWVDLNTWSVENTPFDRIHYFMVFVFGIYIAMNNKSISYTGVHNYLILLTVVVLFYAHKYLMTKGLFFEFQFLQQAAMYPLVYYLLKISRSPFILNKLEQSASIVATVNFLSNHTLEIYMIHETLNRPVLKLELAFPLNIVFFVSVTFIFSAIVNKLAAIARRKIN
jgi:peptidoglycan/LPS O-acetylase OafA/YrhL